jgi:NhaP-type Na+/H+ or K+/H+ antiporter
VVRIEFTDRAGLAKALTTGRVGARGRLALLALVVCLGSGSRPARAAAAEHTSGARVAAGDLAGVQYAFNKQNPRWAPRDEGLGSREQKPYKPLRHAPTPFERHGRAGHSVSGSYALVELAAIVVLGVAAAWTATALRLPVALLALAAGVLAGPVGGVLEPDALFGDLLLPIVSLALAVVLFESARLLRPAEMTRTGALGGGLLGAGTLLLWVIAAAAAYFLLGLSVPLACLLASVLVITGRPLGAPGFRLLEGDAEIGATMTFGGGALELVGTVVAVLLFEVGAAYALHRPPQRLVTDLLRTLGVGVAGGALGGLLLLQVLQHGSTGGRFRRPVVLMFVVGAFSLANVWQFGAGFVAVLALGVVVANQESVPPASAAALSEDGLLALMAMLFVVLAARVSAADIGALRIGSVPFLAIVLLLARPAAVSVWTWRWNLDWRERFMVFWLVPQGIVPLALVSVFVLRFAEIRHAAAAGLVPLVLLVAGATAAASGISGWLVFRWLRVVTPVRRVVSRPSAAR